MIVYMYISDIAKTETSPLIVRIETRRHYRITNKSQ